MTPVPSIVRNLVLFGIFTSLGYVAFAAFLPTAPASFLLLNTYVWIFAFRVFANGIGRPRWPLLTLRVVIDTHDLLFAFCVFGYWCLFWFGIRLIPGGSDASQSAVAFLALNSVLLPLAAYFATERGRRGGFIGLYFLAGLVLILAVVAMELDSTAQDLSTGVAHWLVMLRRLITSPLQILDLVAAWGVTQWLSVPAFCFILAISLEALGDYFAGHRKAVSSTQRGANVDRLQTEASSIIYVRRFIKRRPLAELATCCIEVENSYRTQMRAAIEDALKVAAVPTDGGEIATDPNAETEGLLMELASALQEAEANLRFLKVVQQRIGTEGERVIGRSERRRLFRIAEERCWDIMYGRAIAEARADIHSLNGENAKAAGDDLMAVLGLALSIVIFLANGAPLPAVEGPAHLFGIAIGTAMLGALGSSARILFITPMIRAEGATASLVPPVYAVRPVMLLLIIVAFQASGLDAFLVASNVAPQAGALSTDHNEGWYFGAILATAIAVVIWIASGVDIARRRSQARIGEVSAKLIAQQAGATVLDKDAAT